MVGRCPQRRCGATAAVAAADSGAAAEIPRTPGCPAFLAAGSGGATARPGAPARLHAARAWLARPAGAHQPDGLVSGTMSKGVELLAAQCSCALLAAPPLLPRHPPPLPLPPQVPPPVAAAVALHVRQQPAAGAAVSLWGPTGCTEGVTRLSTDDTHRAGSRHAQRSWRRSAGPAVTPLCGTPTRVSEPASDPASVSVLSASSARTECWYQLDALKGSAGL